VLWPYKLLKELNGSIMKTGYIIRGIHGAIKGSKNLLLKKVDKLKPTGLVLMATELCNSRCITCNIWQNKKTFEPLSPEEIKKTLKDPLFKELKVIINTGGEITTRSDIKEVLLAEYEVLPNAVLQFSTNAILPERALDAIKTVLEKGAKVDVGISLDGIKEKHDQIRRVKGNFEKADWLIKELLKLKETYCNKLDIGIGTMLIDETIPNIEEIKIYVKGLKLNHNIQWYNATPFYSNSGTSKENNKETITNIVKGLPPSPLNKRWLEWLDGKPIKFSCFAMHSFCVLKSNGDIVPCLTYWDTKAGNVRENTPTEIWNSKAAKETRRVVENCQGCLNAWGLGWSFETSFYPNLFYYIKHLNELKKL
jgi:MoaA/NifB/PqqE/SkfB family radical SAM enzyme